RNKYGIARNASRDGSFGSNGPLFRSCIVSKSELGCDEFGVIQSHDDVAMAGQVIRQECVASPTAAAARMREKDDRANSNRFRWIPNVAREAAVAGGVERLRAPLVNSESARAKWVVCHAVNDTSFPQHNAVACASSSGGRYASSRSSISARGENVWLTPAHTLSSLERLLFATGATTTFVR